jgi:RNA recognition motif-containing protein
MQSKKLADVKFNQRLIISNLPEGHSENLIFDLSNCFGKVTDVQLILDPETKRFKGSAYVDFESEFEAK